MDEITKLQDMDIVILCGGQGERLRSVIGEQPKALAKIGERTFLDILIDNILQYGFKRIILSVGYLRKQIKSHFDSYKDFEIIFSEEEKPLGTGGALKKAKPIIRTNPFIVTNGDSICKVDLRNFFDFHIEKSALLSIVLVRSRITQDYGSITLDDSKKIISFNEKGDARSESLISAGIYLFQKDIFSHMPKQNHFSLEYDFFPKIIKNNSFGFLSEDEFIDIGTPERYEKAIMLLRNSSPKKVV